MADTAATHAGYDLKDYYGEPAFSESIAGLWFRRYLHWDGKHTSNSPATFTVIVYDKSSRTEVSCVGISAVNVEAAIDESATPDEIKPFVASGKIVV